MSKQQQLEMTNQLLKPATSGSFFGFSHANVRVHGCDERLYDRDSDWKNKKKCQMSVAFFFLSLPHTHKKSPFTKKKKKAPLSNASTQRSYNLPCVWNSISVVAVDKNYSGPSLSNPHLLLAKSAGSRKRKNGNKFIFLRYPCIQTYISSTFLIQTRIIHGREILNCRTSAQPEL